MIGLATLTCGLALLVGPGDEIDKLVTEQEIEAPVAVVWKAFTTAEGLKGWNVAHASVDLRIGGKMLTHYNPAGKLGDPGTIENTYLSFEPLRMLSIRATKAPEGFPYKIEIERTWSVIYFDEIAPNKTKVRIVGLGYGTDDNSQQMKKFFKSGNAMLMKKLAEYCKTAK